jgi:hypothetical protein
MTIKLPLGANDLVDAAQAQLDEESRTVHTAMLEEILPKAIESIFAYHQESNELLSTYSDIRHDRLIPVIAQTLWSYPGSLGASRISKALVVEGFKPKDANRLTEAVLNYTRYPMSIVNYMRHLGSAIRSIRNIFYGPKVSETIINELGYSRQILTQWVASANSLNTSTIRDTKTFQDWLTAVEDHLRLYMPMQVRINRFASGREVPPIDERPRFDASPLVRAYVRRFGNYVAAHAGLDINNTRSDGTGATVKDEFEKLLATFTGSKKEIFHHLEADYEIRARRISASVTRHSENTRRAAHSAQNNIEQNLNINGKKVEIRTSKASLPNSLIEQFIKSFNLQYSLNPDQPMLSSRMLVDGEFIEVEVERPEKADLKKIQTFIESMYLS